MQSFIVDFIPIDAIEYFAKRSL